MSLLRFGAVQTRGAAFVRRDTVRVCYAPRSLQILLEKVLLVYTARGEHRIGHQPNLWTVFYEHQYSNPGTNSGVRAAICNGAALVNTSGRAGAFLCRRDRFLCYPFAFAWQYGFVAVVAGGA